MACGQGFVERADVRYVVRDWLAKLQIVAAGLAITTIAPVVLRAVPDGVKIVAVRGEPQEVRRLVLARRPGRVDPAVARVADALLGAVRLDEAPHPKQAKRITGVRLLTASQACRR